MSFEVFISYAYQDKPQLTQLTKHLSNLKNQGVISAWYDGDVAPGTDWQKQILEHLKFCPDYSLTYQC